MSCNAWEEPYILAGYQIARALKDNPARFCFRTAQSYVKRYPPPFNYFESVVLGARSGVDRRREFGFRSMTSKGFPKDAGRVLNLAGGSRRIPAAAGRRPERGPRELRLEPPVVGFVGRLTQAKGLDVLMQAMERVGG